MCRVLTCFILLGLVVLLPSAQTVPRSVKKSVDPTAKQADLIKQGIKLHEMQRYQEAIDLYKGVLSENPDCVIAIHEIAFSYFALKDYKECLDAAMKGCSYESDILSQFCTIAGNALSNLGRNQESLPFFAKAIASKGADFQVYYNYAVELQKAGRLQEATAMAEKCALLEPEYASNHLSLSLLYREQSRYLEALLACCRFLVLEANTDRSDTAIHFSIELLRSFMTIVTYDKDTKETSVHVPSEVPNDLPNFRVSLITATTFALDVAKEQVTKGQAIETTYKVSFKALEEDNPGKRPEFGMRYYGPYFRAIAKEDLVEAFYNYAYQRFEPQAYHAWLKSQRNERLLSDFVTWSKNYKWPRS